MQDNSSESKIQADVVIVGAGPVGMLTALRLGQAGVNTLVIEGHDTLLKTTRAVVYMPMVMPILRDLGILDTVVENAYLNTEGISWRDIEGKLLANLPLSSSDPDAPRGNLILGQWRMNALVLEELKKYPCVRVRFGLKLTAINDSPSSPTVNLTARNPQDPNSPDVHLTASYVLGTDGANSTTRQLLNIPYTGMMYDSIRLIGADVVHDFITHEGFSPLNFVVHPTDWAVVTYTGQDESGAPAAPTSTPRPQWRIAYPEPASLPSDKASIWTRAQAQIPKYIHNSSNWTLTRAEPYMISQRSADRPSQSRAFLAGDALHCNNPIGGLGLTGGILDAYRYGNAFVRVLRGGESADLLSNCAQTCLDVWRGVTDGLSQANIERLRAEGDAEAGRKREDLFRALNDEVSQDEVGAKMRAGLNAMVGDDFSRGVHELIHPVE